MSRDRLRSLAAEQATDPPSSPHDSLQAKESADELIAQKATLDKDLADLKKEAIEAERVMRSRCGMIGNIVAEGCPISQTEVRSPARPAPSALPAAVPADALWTPVAQDDNALIRRYHPDGPDAQPSLRTDIIAHHEVLHRLGAFDLERGASRRAALRRRRGES